MQIYLAAAPDEAQEASKYCRRLANVAYRIGPESTLLRQSLLLRARGGLLSVSDRDAPVIADPDALCAAVLRECGRWGYQGVLLDFEDSIRPDLFRFAERLAASLSGGRAVYVPETYASVPHAVPLICTAISGGSFADRLREAAARQGGADRLALDVQRLRMDFCLPARTGEGAPLSADEFHHLLEAYSPSMFFSKDLCARYFTYTDKGNTHFVLFDDSDTLHQKLRIGTQMGFQAAVLMWPEIRDIAPKLHLS